MSRVRSIPSLLLMLAALAFGGAAMAADEHGGEAVESGETSEEVESGEGDEHAGEEVEPDEHDEEEEEESDEHAGEGVE